MNINEMEEEIERVKNAIETSKSDKLKSDYGKRLRKLERERVRYKRCCKYEI